MRPTQTFPALYQFAFQLDTYTSNTRVDMTFASLFMYIMYLLISPYCGVLPSLTTNKTLTGLFRILTRITFSN